jgi:hypothetical protein
MQNPVSKKIKWADKKNLGPHEGSFQEHRGLQPAGYLKWHRAARAEPCQASGPPAQAPVAPPRPAPPPRTQRPSQLCPRARTGGCRAPARWLPAAPPLLPAGETISSGGGRGGANALLNRKRKSEAPEVVGILGNQLFTSCGCGGCDCVFGC